MHCAYFCDLGGTKNSRQACPEICGSFCPSVCGKMVGFEFEVTGRTALPPVTFMVPDSDYDKYDGGAKKSGFTVNLLVLGLGVGAALVMLIILWLLYYYGKKWNEASRELHRVLSRMEAGENGLDGDGEEDQVVDHPIWYIRTQGLQQSVIDSISIVKFKKGEGLVEGTDCSICLSEFEEDESLRLLPKCRHAFHVYCIDTWFGSHKNCPLCRTAIPLAVVGDMAVLTEEELQEAVRREHEQPNLENGIDTEGQQEDGTDSSEVNTPIGDLDSDSPPSIVDANNGMSPNKDLLAFIVCNAKSITNLVERRGVLAMKNEDQPMRRSISADPTTASKIYKAVANIRMSVDSEASREPRVESSGSGSTSKTSSPKNELVRPRGAWMKRSVSYGGKPYSTKPSRSPNPVLPY